MTTSHPPSCDPTSSSTTQIATLPQDQTHRLLFEDSELTIERDFGNGNSFFDRVTKVRRSGDGPTENFFDPYSYHYLLSYRGSEIGTSTITWLADGPIDCQTHYPERLLHRYREHLISGTKLRINQSECSSIRTLRQFITSILSDHVDLGYRLNVINAERNLVPFYRRLGFQVVQNYDFVHPSLGTDSVVMLMAVDPNHRSFFQSIFERSEHPLSQADALATCDPIFTPTRSSGNVSSTIGSSLPQEVLPQDVSLAEASR